MRNIKSFLLIITILLSSLVLTITVSSKEYTDTGLMSLDEVSVFRNSNRYTQKEDDTIVTSPYVLDDSLSSMNTSLGKVYYDTKSLYMMFESKSGYLWSTAVYNSSANINTEWRNKAKSIVTLNYFDKNGKAFSENLFTEDKKTKSKAIVTISKETDTLNAHIVFALSKIELDLIINFTEDGFKVNIPFDSIKENDDFKIGSIDLMQFFGAVGSTDTGPEINGYIMVPDGSGALIRYSKPNTNITSNYEKEFYGRDITYSQQVSINRLPSNGALLKAPVFGFVHGVNQNGIFANITKGSEYGLLNVSYAGVENLNYSRVYPTFIYRRNYSQPIDSNGASIYLLQSNPNKFDISIEYDVLDGNDASYIGMANIYKNYLINNGLSKIEKTTNTSLLLQTLGLEISKGDFFNDRNLMTTVSDMSRIVKELKNQDINNISVLYEGYTSKGYTYEAPLYKGVASSVGSKAQIEGLKELVDKLYFSMDIMKASEKGGGYSTYVDLAKKISMQTYDYNEYSIKSYLLTLDKIEDLYSRNRKSLSKYGIDSFAYRSLSSILYSDYQKNTSRIDMVERLNSLLDEKTGLYSPNAYMYSKCESYFDMSLYSSQYTGFTDSVPFIPLVLNDFMNLYSTNANFFANARDELLRIVDYNVNLSFIITSEASSKLIDTPLEYIYSSGYDSLKSAVKLYYDFVNEPLKEVRSATLTNRVVLDNGVVLNEYSNGVKIIVNYTNNSYDYSGISVGAKYYEVIK